MKIAVLNSNGVQSNMDGKKRFYYLVDDAYDFTTNSATDVTEIKLLKTFHHLHRLTFTEYRDSVKNHYVNELSSNWSGCPTSDKIILSQLFIVDKAERDSVLDPGDIQDSYLELVSKTNQDKIKTLSGADETSANIDSSLLENSLLESERIICLDFAISGIYSHSSSNYVQIPLQVMVPKATDILDGSTTIQGKWQISYYTSGSNTASVMLYNYTDGIDFPASEKAIANGSWISESCDWFDIDELKAYRLKTKRVGGNGNNTIQVEGLSLLIKVSK